MHPRTLPVLSPRVSASTPLCPSARPDWRGSVVLGVAEGSLDTPRVSYLTARVEVSAAVLQLAGSVSPTEVFRFAAPCACDGCVHFQEKRCHLVEKVVELLPEVVSSLPPCSIRRDCRWFRQEGGAACRRCPQIVTDSFPRSEQLVAVANPSL